MPNTVTRRNSKDNQRAISSHSNPTTLVVTETQKQRIEELQRQRKILLRAQVQPLTSLISMMVALGFVPIYQSFVNEVFTGFMIYEHPARVKNILAKFGDPHIFFQVVDKYLKKVENNQALYQAALDDLEEPTRQLGLLTEHYLACANQIHRVHVSSVQELGEALQNALLACQKQRVKIFDDFFQLLYGKVDSPVVYDGMNYAFWAALPFLYKFVLDPYFSNLIIKYFFADPKMDQVFTFNIVPREGRDQTAALLITQLNNSKLKIFENLLNNKNMLHPFFLCF